MDPLNTIDLSDPIVILAEHGFFVDNNSTQASIHRGDAAVMSLHNLICKKKYSIKRVVMTQSTIKLDDVIDSLLRIEVECWYNLQIDRDRIRLRLSSNVCWIAIVEDEIVGVLYCQLIESVSPIIDGCITFTCQEDLHTAHGHIMQLLGVAVLPSYAQLQIGNALRDFVLQVARHSQLITSVIAMTRCSSSTSSVDHYFQKIHSSPPQDPTLLFHVNGGASIVSVVSRYRPDDHTNYGYAIMIKYNTQSIDDHRSDPVQDGCAISVNEALTDYDSGRRHDNSHDQQESIPEDNGTIISRSHKLECVLTLTEVLSFISDMRQEINSSVDTTHHSKDDPSCISYADVSFMHLGLDSLSMMEIRNRLNAVYHNYITTSRGVSSASTSSYQLSPTLLFDFPTPKLLVAEFNRQVQVHLHVEASTKSAIDSPAVVVSGSTETFLATATQLSPSRTKQPSTLSSSSLVAEAAAATSSFAVIGMSCRFPGGCNDPDLFHRKLCDGLDAITVIPDDWNWNANTTYVSVLNDNDAEVFDPGYFQLNTKEAELMDPHQRLILELCYEALLDARMLGDVNKGSRMDAMTIGVFVGQCNNDWMTSSSVMNDVGPYSSTGTAMSATANRVSFLLGLTGPSMVIDTGVQSCSFCS